MTEYEKAKQAKIDQANALKAKNADESINNLSDIKSNSAATMKVVGFKAKLSNYWYHYKVHTIVIVVIVTLLLVTLWDKIFQEKFDISLYVFSNQSLSQYKSDIKNSLKNVAEDYDGNGRVKIKLKLREIDYDNDTAFKKSYTVSGDLSKQEYFLVLTDEKGIEELQALGLQFANLTFYGNNDSVSYNKLYLKDSTIRELLPNDAVFDDMMLCLVDENFGYNGAVGNSSKGSAIAEMTGVPVEQLVPDKEEGHFKKNEEFIMKLITTK